MNKLCIYKLKDSVTDPMMNLYKYYFMEDFFTLIDSEGNYNQDVICNMIGVDVETLKMSQLSNRYAVSINDLRSLFEEKPFMTFDDILEKEKELEDKSWDNFPM